MMLKRNDISLEKIKNDLEIKKMSKLHVEIMNMKLINGCTKNANQYFFNLPNCLKVHLNLCISKKCQAFYIEDLVLYSSCK
jgi:hypothetical protein